MKNIRFVDILPLAFSGATGIILILCKHLRATGANADDRQAAALLLWVVSHAGLLLCGSATAISIWKLRNEESMKKFYWLSLVSSLIVLGFVVTEALKFYT